MDQLSFAFANQDLGAQACNTLLSDGAAINSLPGALLQSSIDAVCSFILSPEVRLLKQFVDNNCFDSLEVVQFKFIHYYLLQTTDLFAEGDMLIEKNMVKAKPFRGALRTLLLIFHGASQHSLTPQQFQHDLDTLCALSEILYFICCP
jgi:hypothetical protein